MSFTWIPFYRELAGRLLPFRERQEELIALLQELQSKSLPVISLVDKDSSGASVPLSEIDPFTFFANFNRGIRDDNRRQILTVLKQKFGIKSEIPDDFDGIPIVQNLKSWYFTWAAKRTPDDIPNLWKIAAIAVEHSPDQVPSALFKACVSIEQVNLPKMTMGLFWLNPDEYLAVDSVMRSYAQNMLAISPPVGRASKNEYVQFLQSVRDALPGRRFCEISQDAWMIRKGKATHWILALGPKSEFWDDCHAKGKR